MEQHEHVGLFDELEPVDAVPLEEPTDRRQLEDLDVPEHMPLVGTAGQRARADRDARIAVGRDDQVIRVEAESLLCRRTATDAYVCALPEGFPARPMRGEREVEVLPALRLDVPRRR